MKIRIRKNGSTKLSAQTDQDSIELLKVLECLAGKENDPNRLSLKKEQELKDRQKIS